MCIKPGMLDIPDGGEFDRVGNVFVDGHLQQLAGHPIGGVFESLSGFGFDGWGVAAVVGTHATACNRRAHASVAVLAMRGATVGLDFGFGNRMPPT